MHNKFAPKQLSRRVRNDFKKATQALYSVSEIESTGDEEDEVVMGTAEASTLEEKKLAETAAIREMKTNLVGNQAESQFKQH